MTQSAFDPVCFGPYTSSKPPPMIHFEYNGSEDVHRYVLVEVIPHSDISPITRRKHGESQDAEVVAQEYLNPKGYEEPARPVRGVPEKPELPSPNEEVDDGPVTEVATAATEPAEPVQQPDAPEANA